MQKDAIRMPTFKSESDEADWWASAEGRRFVRAQAKALEAKGIKPSGSRLAARLAQTSIQIAIRLPAADVEQARKIASRKGVGYQTLLKMLVHEGLRRESRRG